MLRANTAVALVLLAVLVVALVAVLAGMRAARNQARAEDAEAAGRDRLWNAYLAEAKAVRISGEAGRRETALAVISNAAAMHTSSALRTEAIASLALSDLVQEGELLPVSRDLTAYDFDADLRRYAYGDQSGSVTVGGFAERTNLFTLQARDLGAGTQTGVVNVCFSPDCKRLAARFVGGAVVVWDLETKKPMTTINPLATNSGILSDLHFSPDSQKVIFTDVADHSLLSVFEADTGRKLSSGAQVGRSLYSLRPDGRQVAKVAHGGVELQDYPMGTNRQILKHLSQVYVLAWSPDGNLLATSCADGDVYLWDLKRDTHRILQGHTERGIWLGFSADGTRLFASSLDGTTRLWQVPDANAIAIGEGIGRTISADGSRLGYALPLTGFSTWRLLTNANYQLLTCPRSEGPLLTLDLSISGRWCVATQDKGFRIWNLQAGGQPSVMTLPGIYCVRVSVDERSLIVGRDTGLEVWPLSTNSGGDVTLQPLSKKNIPLPEALGARSVALSLDGHSAAVELTDHRMVVLDLASERAPVVLKSRWRQVYLFKEPASVTGAGRFAISPDGRWVATGYDFGSNDVPRVWDAHTGDLVTNLNADTSVVTFSPDGRWLGLAGTDQYSIWSVGDWRRKAIYPRDESSYVHGTMAFGRQDGLLAVASARQRVQLRSLLSEEKYFDLIGPEPQSVRNVRMSLDGSVLVTSTGNDMVQVWRLDRLNRELAGMNLAWQEPSTSRVGQAAPTVPGSGGLRTTLILSLAGVLLTGVLAQLILRQHRAGIARFMRAEAETSQSNRELEKEKELHQLKTNFISMVSHEIRTPLANILSSAEILDRYLDRLGPEERAEQLGAIHHAVDRMKALLEDVLFFSRAEAGRIAFNAETFDLEAFCRQMADETAAANGTRNPIQFQMAPVSAPAFGDTTLLRHIVGNLLGNAVKYSAAGAPVVLEVARQGNEAVICVRDRGIGVTAEDFKQLFVPFFRGHNAAAHQGTGLGLAIVRHCVERHGGRIEIASTENVGTTVTVRLPVFAKSSDQTRPGEVKSLQH